MRTQKAIKATAVQVKKSGISAHDAFLLGWGCASCQAIKELEKMWEGHKGLVSYTLAAAVLKSKMEQIEDGTAEETPPIRTGQEREG